MNLAATIGLNATGFLNPLNAARSAMGGFTGALQSLGNFGNVLTGIQSGLNLVRGAISPLGDAIRGAADFEGMNAEFEVMLGSAEKARKLVGDIKGFAAATPFETAGLAANAKTLLAFGTSGTQVLPIIKMLGDVAGGSQEKLNQLTLAFSQISSAGKLQGQDLLQLVNAGFNPLQEMSRKSGKSMAALRDEMEKGGISAQMVADAFASATSEGGRFFGNTAAQGKSFNGIFSTLKDSIAELYRAFGQPVMLALKPVLEQAAQIAGALVPLATALGEKFARVATGVGSMVTTLAKGLIGAFNAGEVGNLLAGVLRAAGGVFLAVVSTGLATAVNVVGTSLKGAFQSAVNILADTNFWQGIRGTVIALIREAKATLLEAAAAVAETMGFTGRAGKLRKVAENDREYGGKMAAWGQRSFGNVNFSAAMQPMRDASSSVSDILGEAFREIAGDITQNEDIASLGKTFQALAKTIDDVSPVRPPGQQNEKVTLGPAGAGTTAGAAAAQQAANVDALTRVGGLLGSYNPMIAEQRRQASLVAKTNEILTAGFGKLTGSPQAKWA